MQFNPKAVNSKMQHLDEIKQYPELITEVLSRNIQSKYELIEKTRVWNGGEGNTLSN